MDYKKYLASKPLWSRHSKKHHHANPIFEVVSHRSTSVDKKIDNDFFILEAKDWVNVIALTRDRLVVMVAQYRHGSHSWSLEFPGGIVEKTTPDRHLQTAKSELMEETGYSTENWELLGTMRPNPAFLNNWNYSYLALDVELSGEQNLDENEEIEILLVPLAEIPELIRNGVISHSMMLAITTLFLTSPRGKSLL